MPEPVTREQFIRLVDERGLLPDKDGEFAEEWLRDVAYEMWNAERGAARAVWRLKNFKPEEVE